MLIRTQNKIALVNLDLIDTIIYDDTQDVIFAYSPGNIPMDLGDYAGKEKAIKVLDMIQEQYSECQKQKCGRSVVFKEDFVFQMPKDSEVE